MSVDTKAALTDIDRVLTHQIPGGGTQAVAEFAGMVSACIDRHAPPGSSYRAQRDRAFSMPSSKLDQLMRGALAALRADYAAGVAPGTFETLVHAQVFDDLLGQAEYLLAESYRLPAAVIAGAVLEEHLRQLASLNGIAVRKPGGDDVKASVLNSDLQKAGLYSQMVRTQVEAWQKLRNDAAHNTDDFKTVTDQQVKDMLSGVRDFMVRHPA